MGRITIKRVRKYKKSNTKKDKNGKRRCKTCGRFM